MNSIILLPNGMRYRSRSTLVRAAGENQLTKRKPSNFRNTSKNAQTPSRPVHLGMVTGDHFPRKNVLQSGERIGEKCRFLEEKTHYLQFQGAVLRTLC